MYTAHLRVTRVGVVGVVVAGLILGFVPLAFVSASSVSVDSLTPGMTVGPGQQVNFTIVPNGFTAPTISATDWITSSITPGNVNQLTGLFSWTPTNNDVGKHIINIVATDAYGDQAVTTEEIDVTNYVASAYVTSISPGTAVDVGSFLTFGVSTNNFNNPVYTISDNFPGSTIANNSINPQGNFAWTPSTRDIGTHTLTINVTGMGGQTQTLTQVITVLAQGGSLPPAPVVTTPVVITPAPAPVVTTPVPVTTTTYTFSNYLKPGSSGADVSALQKILANLGLLNHVVTGYYGSLTVDAVAALQQAHGLAALGVVGPATRSLLNSLPANTVTTTPNAPTTAPTNTTKYTFNNPLDVGSSGIDVVELQMHLASKDLYSGPITGTYGAETQAAVEAYQTAHNLPALGNVGPATRVDLNAGM